VVVRSTDPLELSAAGEEAETTSHTLLARCMQAAAERGDEQRNARRKQRQTEVFQRFLFTMADRGFRMDPPALFQLYCEATHEYILTYFEGDHANVHVMFGTIDHAPKGSKAHAKMCEYMAGQSVLFQDTPPKPRAYYEGKSYGSLLLMTRDRLGHAMSEEEHARAVEIMEAKDAKEALASTDDARWADSPV